MNKASRYDIFLLKYKAHQNTLNISAKPISIFKGSGPAWISKNVVRWPKVWKSGWKGKDHWTWLNLGESNKIASKLTLSLLKFSSFTRIPVNISFFTSNYNVVTGGGGGAPNSKWRGWSNGGKKSKQQQQQTGLNPQKLHGLKLWPSNLL